MTISEFIQKWSKVQLTERSAAQQHFLELCEVFQHPRPADVDPTGEWYTFDKGVAKQGGGKGWADVWKKGFFGWEYKRKHKDLDAAYNQLLQCREALENRLCGQTVPVPLLVAKLSGLQLNSMYPTGETNPARRILFNDMP